MRVSVEMTPGLDFCYGKTKCSAAQQRDTIDLFDDNKSTHGIRQQTSKSYTIQHAYFLSNTKRVRQFAWSCLIIETINVNI